MKFSILLLPLFVLSSCSRGQSYNDSILQYRQQYKVGFLSDESSPLKASDTAYLRFYAPNEKYCVTADFKVTPGTDTFIIPTHSGKNKVFKQYGIATFKINDTILTLHIYQSIDLIKRDPKFKDYLFVPFTDMTNYTETYGGGRYIDLSTSDIEGSKVVLDFNKCYNPYCAFASGYSCPIPPKENDLHVAIKAGEQLFAKKTQE
ncbi:MAG TPA: DUF1684 domain-containing protein [Flavipsychrobacter sp.]|nr:DUF1684 domain-containing protein [Flavipsychrobacter sp.]